MRLKAKQVGLGLTIGKIYEGQVIFPGVEKLSAVDAIVLVFNDNGVWLKYSLSMFEGAPA